ncbi:MAG: hypothetical protein ABIA02_00895 [Candidatus Falkowbacteria bacterium]
MLYRNILSQALKITWQNKYLWFFGLFATLLGSGGGYDILFKSLNNETDNGILGFKKFAETGIFSLTALKNIGRLAIEEPLSFLMIVVVGLVIIGLFCFLVWLAIVSQAGLVDNSAKLIAEKKNKDLGIQSGVNIGIKNFWPVFSLNFLAKAIVFLVFAILGFIIFMSSGQFNAALSGLLYLAVFIVSVPTSIVFLFIVKYAVAYVVVRGSSFSESIQQGWGLFKKNWLISIEMAFILFFINLVVGFAVALAILVLAVPFLFLALILYKAISLIGFWFIAILAVVLFLAIIILSGAFLASFQIASWTGLFLQLIGKGGVSKIERIASRK